MSGIRGLELLYNLVQSQLTSKADCAVAAIHCLLVDENLLCTGIGEEFSDGDVKSELLPQHWNNNQEVYTLRYISKDFKKRYLVKVVKAGPILHVNIALNEDTTAAMSVNIDKYVSDKYTEFSTTYQDLGSMRETFRRDILEKVILTPSTTNTSTSSGSNLPQLILDPLAGSRPSRPQQRGLDEEPYGVPATFPHIGGQDLDPFGRGRGGMLMDPSDFGVPRNPQLPVGGPYGVPRGSVPPGARFDPFGPPGSGANRGRPNPDHFRRPNDFDDFM